MFAQKSPLLLTCVRCRWCSDLVTWDEDDFYSRGEDEAYNSHDEVRFLTKNMGYQKFVFPGERILAKRPD